MKYSFIILLFFSTAVFSQTDVAQKKILRLGFIYGFSSQNTYIRQDSDYRYENRIYKISAHFNLNKKTHHSWELLVEPSYYNSKHEAYNYWHEYFTSSENGNELRAKFMQLKSINEYVLNLGIIYRYVFNRELSIYLLGNVGPMYIDTDTERLKKGFAFSDIFAFGTNYKLNQFSFDAKSMIRHVSNANFKMPNYGINAVGFELGLYYEFN
ncbi:MAG TPA: hypothetical protein DDZ41_05945 [Flavobacterium sp.]|nr:hypothetical protein [Flavobacterium sp.]